MTGLHAGAQPTSVVAATEWATIPLIDTHGMLQWTEDLAPEQVRAILQQVPLDSRSNAAAIILAVRKNDVPTARRQAHRLKGMAANIGAQRLAEIARAIEHGAKGDAGLDILIAELSTVLDDTLVVIAEIATAE